MDFPSSALVWVGDIVTPVIDQCRSTERKQHAFLV